MYTIKGEARALITTERTFQDQSWVDYKLKIEFEDGTDDYLTLRKDLINEDNIYYLQSLKGRNIECDFHLQIKVGKDNTVYKTLYMLDLPMEK